MRPNARPVPALAALTLALALAGCGGSDGSDGGAPEARIAAMPGVQAASVGPREVEDGKTETVTVVDVEAGATADEVADVLVAMGETDPFRSALYLDAGSTDYATDLADAPSGVWGNDEPEASAPERAGLLVSGAAALPGAQVVVGPGAHDPGGASVDLVLDTTAPSDVTDAARVVLADPTLGTAREVSVTASDVTAGGASPQARLSSDSPMTPELVQGWEDLLSGVAALDGSGVTVAFRGLASLVPTNGSDEVTVVTVDLAFPDGVGAGDLTTDRYGDRLWPFFRARLDFLADQPPGSILRVTRTNAADSVDDLFLDVTTARGGTDATAAPDDHGRTWNAEALDYLDE